MSSTADTPNRLSKLAVKVHGRADAAEPMTQDASGAQPTIHHDFRSRYFDSDLDF